MNTPKKILIVEDENIVALDIKSILIKANYKVCGIYSKGEDAIKNAGELKPDLIIMDIMLSGEIDGIQAAREIQQRYNIPSIYLTANTDSSTLEEAKSTEPLAYIVKPFTYKSLISTVEMSLYKHATEKQLKESEKRYRMLIEYSPAAICIIENRKIRFANRAAISLIGAENAEDIKGADISRFMQPGYVRKNKTKFIEILKSKEQPISSGGKFYNFKGLTLDIEFTAMHIKYEGYDALQVVIRDITETKRKEEQKRLYTEKLKELNKTKDKFFSLISHDLRSPFNSILGFTDILRNEFDELTEEEKLHMINSLYQVTRKIYNMLDNLLQYSKFKTGHIVVEIADYDLRSLIERNFEIMRGIAVKKDIELINLIGKEICVRTDENLLNSILQNLLSNAIKFSKRNSTVKISAETKENEAIIEVTDNGIGLTDKQVNNLFKMEEMTSSAGTEGETGTGLGLLLTKEFIKKLGGSISVVSESGNGTTFTITLPLANQKVEKTSKAIF